MSVNLTLDLPFIYGTLNNPNKNNALRGIYTLPGPLHGHNTFKYPRHEARRDSAYISTQMPLQVGLNMHTHPSGGLKIL